MHAKPLIASSSDSLHKCTVDVLAQECCGLQVPDDVVDCHEMEIEHQRAIEEDMTRERNGIIQALMKRSAGGGVTPLPSPTPLLPDMHPETIAGHVLREVSVMLEPILFLCEISCEGCKNACGVLFRWVCGLRKLV